MSRIEWVGVRDSFGGQEIGAVGFVGNRVAVIVSFYEDADANLDGRVGIGETIASKLSPVGIEGRAIALVAMQGRADPDLMMRGNYNEVAMDIFANFAVGMVMDGIYAAYFARGINRATGAVAGQLTSSSIKRFAIAKGMQSAVKAAYRSTYRE